MNDNLSRISQDLRSGNFYPTNPIACANDLSVLSGEYSWSCTQLENILSRKPSVWNSMRPNYKSDTACERAWEATEDGVNEAGLKLRLKSCEKMMSSLKTLIRLAEMQAHNQV